MFRNPRAAFTLIELMTVIAIIAILASLVFGVAGYAMRKASESRALADIERIKNALEEYRVEFGRYPANTVEADSEAWASKLWQHKPPFLVMKGWNDPAASYPVVDPWGNEYRYYYDSDGSPRYAEHNNSKFGYDLWSEGPDLTDESDNINNW